MIFSRARAEAPCVLILEDLDSLITDMNRSFFDTTGWGIKAEAGARASAGGRSRRQVQRQRLSRVESSRVCSSVVWSSVVECGRALPTSPSLTRQIGTTNHFDKLDPALSNRPSRFDRK
jgi:SpoVK/Ycf46/Vps4 family AAA+-type ATPase